MKYRYKPLEVTALVIISVTKNEDGGVTLGLENGTIDVATPQMLARMDVLPGDYLVTAPDGYIYLNPKAVFESKFDKIEEHELVDEPIQTPQ